MRVIALITPTEREKERPAVSNLEYANNAWKARAKSVSYGAFQSRA